MSLAGTIGNCAGGSTPWGTWLTGEETDEVLDEVRHPGPGRHLRHPGPRRG